MPVSVATRRPSASSASRTGQTFLSSYASLITSLDLTSSSRLTSPVRSVRHGPSLSEDSGVLSRYSSTSRERSTEPRSVVTDRSSREPSKSRYESRLDSRLESRLDSRTDTRSRLLDDYRPSYSSSKVGRPPLHSTVATSASSEDSSRSYARSRSTGTTAGTATMTTSSGKPFHSRFLKPKPPPDEKANDKAGNDKEPREEADDNRNNNSVGSSVSADNKGADAPGGAGDEDDAEDESNGNDRRRPSVAALRQRFDVTTPATLAPEGKHRRDEETGKDDAVPTSSQSAPLAGGHEDPARHQRLLETQSASNALSSASPGPSSDSDNFESPRVSRRSGSGSHTANGARGSGLNGLRNIGNTCFMNSVIQCLSNTRPLLEYLLKQNYLSEINTTNSSMKGALIKAFAKMIEELWTGEGQVINTSAFKGQIQHFAPRFMGYSQQDAQEFLRYLLEGLHEDVNRVERRPTNTALPDIDDSLSDNQKAEESWRRYTRIDDSTVVDAFVGQLKSTLQCTVCGHCSVTFDPFWDLSLPIPSRTGQLRLQQCLEHFTREEVLDGDEKPTCAKCQTRRKCTKSFSIQKFPKILVLHLKRFSPMERFRGKLNVTVEFPLNGLDLSAYAANRGRGCTYNLYGVANHSGTTYSGHYTAYCKHPYTQEWHEYNDSRVSSISSRSVVSSEAYVLFYELSGHTSHL